MLDVFLYTLYISMGFFFLMGLALFVAAVAIKFFGSHK